MSDRRKILVTGAGGFIGGRIAEVMHALEFGDVRAGMRRWASGARVGRLPVDLVQCDVRNAEHVKDALDGVTDVVHCAVGDRATTVEGTRTILEGALEHGVNRVVHLSTIDVYGSPAEGDINEDRPLSPTGQEYGDTKIEAENVCREFADRGLHVTILRPTLVHGPFSAYWTIAYAERLQKRPWLVAEADAQGICNLIYVDDLVGMIMRSLQADIPAGEAFNANGPGRTTWHEYFSKLNDAMGLPPLAPATATGARLRAGGMEPFRNAARFLAKNFERPIKSLAKSSPPARALMVEVERVLRTTPAPSEFGVYSRTAYYATDKASEMLGYQGQFPVDEAVALTGAWLRQNGFVKNGQS